MTKIVRFINKYLFGRYQFVPKEPSADTIVFIMSKINPTVLNNHSYNDYELEKLRTTNQEYYSKFLTSKEIKDLENRAYRIYNDILWF